MKIIIHRKTVNDLRNTFDFLVEKFKKNLIEIDDESLKKFLIVVGEYEIDFFCGDVCKMGGVRPMFYNTDSKEASDFLRISAKKCGGIQIKHVNDLFEILRR